MHFNGDKFECIRFWSKNQVAPNFDYLGPDGRKIDVKKTLKELFYPLTCPSDCKLRKL